MVGRIALAVLAVAYVPIAARSTNYFVSSSGSDSAAGTSAAPWRTLQHAADVTFAGDRVTARAGNYVGFDLRHSGSAALPIEFVADPGVLINAASQVRKNSSG